MFAVDSRRFKTHFSCFSTVLLLASILSNAVSTHAGHSAVQSSSHRKAGVGLGIVSVGGLRVVTGKPDSVVYLVNVRQGITTEAGVLDLPRLKAGTYFLKVRTRGCIDWRGTVVVIAGVTRTVKLAQRATSDQAEMHYQEGDQLRENGKHEEAAGEYNQALASRPSFPEARLALARSLTALQRFDEAEKQIEAAMRDHRGPYPEAQTVLANLRRYQGLTDEAIVEYRKALQSARSASPEAHIGLAIALEQAGRADEAIKEYRIGIEQDMDTEPILYFLLGSALEKYKRYKEAIEAYVTYLRLDPEGQYASAVESIIERLKEEIDRR